MSRTITLELPEETYATIKAEAAARGLAPEQIVTQWVAAAVQRHVPGATEPEQVGQEEPLEALIGTLACEAGDVADRHDDYIGQALAGETGAPRRG